MAIAAAPAAWTQSIDIESLIERPAGTNAICARVVGEGRWRQDCCDCSLWRIAEGGKPLLWPTTLVGSYAQPEWLIDRAKLASRFPPRVRAKELWRIPEPYLAEAQDDATVLAIRAQEEAGLDIITDGEIRHKSISNRLAPALAVLDLGRPGVSPTVWPLSR
jgi:hypothetical protein